MPFFRPNTLVRGDPPPQKKNYDYEIWRHEATCIIIYFVRAMMGKLLNQ